MSTYKHRKLITYGVLAILLTITVLTWQHFEKMSMERDERRYNEYTDGIVKDITERLDMHKMILQGGAGVFYASEEVTREEWLAYYQYQQVRTLYPGIQGVAFARIVKPSILAQHIEEIKAEGFPEYTVWPAEERDLYAPVIYIEPFDEQNQHYLGYDLFSAVELRTVMEQAQETGEVSMSGKLSLMQETDEGTQHILMMFAPVYEQGMPLNSAEERREANKGYVFCTYFMTELMQSIFPDPVHKIDFFLYDGSEITSEALMYNSHVALDAAGNERRPLFTSQKILDIYGHQWTLVFETMPDFEMTVDRYTPKIILAAGLLISFLFFFYLRMMERTGERAHSLARKMTSALRESEEKFRQISDNIGEVFWLHNADTTQLIYVNPAYEKVWERSCQSLYDNPRSFIDSVYDPDKPAVIAAYEEYLKTHTFDLEYRIVGADGQIKWILAKTFPVTDSDGKVVRHTGTAVDITNSKQLEKKINDSKKMYQSVVDTQLEMVCRYLPDTTLTFVNDAYCRAFGKPRRELLGQKYLIFIPPECHEEEHAGLKLLSAAQPKATREYEVIDPDGNNRWQRWTDVGVFDESGELKEIQGTGYDITERKLAEGEARHQAQRANAMLRIASHLNAELELDKVKSIICEEACSILQVQMSAYLRYDSNTRLFHLAASSGLSEVVARAFDPLSQDDIDRLFNKLGKSNVIPDLAAVSEQPFAQTMLSYGIRVSAYSLVERDGLPIGILIIGDDKKSDLPEDTIDTLSGLANQVASAITNARLFSEAKNRLHQIQALRNIDLAITGSLDLRVTFQVVLDEVTSMLNTDAAAILRLDPHTGTLKYERWRGFRRIDFDRISIPLGEGYAGRVALNRKSVHIQDLRDSPQDAIHVPFIIDEGFIAYYAVPLIAKGSVLGVLEVFHRELLVSNGEWLSFLETLAGQAAIAIDNAELFSKLERSNVDLLRAYDATIEGWAHALDLKDEETEDHSQRVTELTLRIASKMSIKDEDLAHVRRGALLHDIGKMGIPDSILLKPGKLTDDEWEIMRKHPVYAFEMLSSIDYLRPALDIPYCHHERWDGSGYPRGLKGKQIPLEARIFAVVDVFDALTNDRPYRKAWARETALEYIREQSGKHFDPQVLSVFMHEVGDLVL